MSFLTDLSQPIWRSDLTVAGQRQDVQARLTALRDCMHAEGSEIALFFEAGLSLVSVLPLLDEQKGQELAGYVKRVVALGVRAGETYMYERAQAQALEAPAAAMPSGAPESHRLNDMLLGEILIQFGFATKKDIGQALSHQAMNPRPIGTVLLEQNVVTEEDLTTALRLQTHLTRSSMNDLQSTAPQEECKLGQIMVSKGWITPEILVDALRAQQHRGGRLGEILVDFAAVTWDQVNEALREQERVSR